MALRQPGLIALFDVDGTLTAPRKGVTPTMLKFMQELRKVVNVGVVGGSDLVKISEQLGSTVINDYDYVFAENGLVAYKDGKLVGTQSLKTYLGEEKIKVKSFLSVFMDLQSVLTYIGVFGSLRIEISKLVNRSLRT
ncbi:putative phosphomannomutase [Helianthus annuus]|nr:putative phosphomannomutase [Helianthus annuus]